MPALIALLLRLAIYIGAMVVGGLGTTVVQKLADKRAQKVRDLEEKRRTEVHEH